MFNMGIQFDYTYPPPCAGLRILEQGPNAKAVLLPTALVKIGEGEQSRHINGSLNHRRSISRSRDEGDTFGTRNFSHFVISWTLFKSLVEEF